MEKTTILWDAGDAIYPFNIDLAFSRLAANSTKGLSVETIKEILFGKTYESHEYNAGITEDYYLGKESDEQFYERAKKSLGLTFSIEEFERAYSDIFTVNSRIARFIEHANQQGYAQAVVSSTNPFHWKAMRKTIDPQTGKPFDMEAIISERNIITTYKVGVKKPDAALFDRALAVVGRTKEQAVYVDDVLTYVEAARQYGLSVIHMNTKAKDPQGNCLNALEELGVIIE
ncbi:hypothetical protein COV18_02080 [Candidatus Woesearchaeota archaeon CG10_big_fil_rev_8_21_14_0_10_37_12]|nr:MAG: hypothetical protein COV18_02080 [Candidatus Woesearchaeota archaeon CG10_big_fil_rev_8_21_14_0_10_37_12]